jgi:hypothetical protein
VLNVPEGARELGISVQAMWKLVYSGRIPFVRINRSIRLRDEDIRSFIQQNLTRHGVQGFEGSGSAEQAKQFTSGSGTVKTRGR